MAQEDLSVKYFATFAGYTLPLKLQHNLSKTEAEARRAYYIARYDAAGRLQQVRKIFNGATFFVHDYVYDARGVLVEARLSNKEGEISILRRTKSGRMVKVN